MVDTRYIKPLLMCISSFNLICRTAPKKGAAQFNNKVISREFCNINFDRSQKRLNKGKDKEEAVLFFVCLLLFFLPIIQIPYSTFVPNFTILGALVGEKEKRTNKGQEKQQEAVKEWKMEKRKPGKTKVKNLSILVFFPTIDLATLKVYAKFKDSDSH